MKVLVLWSRVEPRVYVWQARWRKAEQWDFGVVSQPDVDSAFDYMLRFFRVKCLIGVPDLLTIYAAEAEKSQLCSKTPIENEAFAIATWN